MSKISESAARQLNYQSQYQQDVVIPEGPDLSKMHSYKVGKTTYLFRKKEKLIDFKEKHEAEMKKENERLEAIRKEREKEAALIDEVDGETCGGCYFFSRSVGGKFRCQYPEREKRVRLSDPACLNFKPKNR